MTNRMSLTTIKSVRIKFGKTKILRDALLYSLINFVIKRHQNIQFQMTL